MRMLLLMGADSEMMGFLSYIVLRFGYCKLESSCCNYSLDCCNPLLCGVSKSNLRMCLRIAWPPLQRYHRKPRASPPHSYAIVILCFHLTEALRVRDATAAKLSYLPLQFINSAFSHLDVSPLRITIGESGRLQTQISSPRKEKTTVAKEDECADVG